MRCTRLLIVGLVAACQGAPATSVTSSELVTLSPSTWDFGALEVGMTSGAQTFSVNPTGTNYTDVVNTVSESCPDFFVTANGLPADIYRICDNFNAQAKEQSAICTLIDYQNYTFTANFRPTVAGATSCVVNIGLDSGPRTITLYGTGTIPPIAISVTPTSVGFGDVRRNTASTASTVMVRNLGSGNMSITGTSISAQFAITSGPNMTTVGPGGSQAYTITCNPTTVGAKAGNFTVTSNDPTKPTVNVPLTCNGIDSNLDISPSPAALPTTRVGEPVESTINLTNSGTAPMNIVSVVLASTDLELVQAPPANTMLGVSQGTTARVRFPAGAEATASGMLTITYDTNQTRTVQISGRALATSMAVTPDGDVDLGPVCAGQTNTAPFTVIANAEADFKITAIAPPSAPFSLTAPALPITARGNAANKVMLDVKVSPEAAGPMSSTMTLTTDIPGGMPREIHLSAIGLDAGVSGTPALLDLGAQELDLTTIGQDVSVTNCTTAPANLSNARIEGPDAGSFAIVQQPASGTLAPTAVAKWLVVFTPRTSGEKTATFLVDHDTGTATVMLAGEGLGNFPGSGKGPTSYYGSCSTTNPATGWLILIALIALRRRRR